MVSRFLQVPRERAEKHDSRSRQYITYPPPHSAHFAGPENRNLGRRACLNFVRSPRFVIRRMAVCQAFARFQSSSSTMRRSGTSLVIHASAGLRRETRRPVSGSFMYRRRFQTKRPT
jgi:hypothetical protein